MKYWFGYRATNADGSDPGSPCLLGPFDSYEDAKIAKASNRAMDMAHTDFFQAPSEQEARKALEKYSFSKI